jgi:hypothetical protein
LEHTFDAKNMTPIIGATLDNYSLLGLCGAPPVPSGKSRHVAERAFGERIRREIPQTIRCGPAAAHYFVSVLRLSPKEAVSDGVQFEGEVTKLMTWPEVYCGLALKLGCVQPQCSSNQAGVFISSCSNTHLPSLTLAC